MVMVYSLVLYLGFVNMHYILPPVLVILGLFLPVLSQQEYTRMATVDAIGLVNHN